MKLVFHTTLISIFETIFYFLYVSTLENNGIERTVDTFINGAVDSCLYLTPLQIEIIDDLLNPFINATQIIDIGIIKAEERSRANYAIMMQSWAYVGAFSGIFLLLLIYSRIRQIKILWKSVILENLALVFMLALYEWMFFETIIYPYAPITADEIAKNAIEDLQSSCGILL